MTVERDEDDDGDHANVVIIFLIGPCEYCGQNCVVDGWMDRVSQADSFIVSQSVTDPAACMGSIEDCYKTEKIATKHCTNSFRR